MAKTCKAKDWGAIIGGSLLGFVVFGPGVLYVACLWMEAFGFHVFRS